MCFAAEWSFISPRTGGIDQPNGAYDEKEKILIIKGRAKIAGIDITYV